MNPAGEELRSLAGCSPGEAAHAHLQLLQQSGTGAWLQALPAEALGLSLEPAFFLVIRGYALCGGDRCKRYSRLRTLLAESAAVALRLRSRVCCRLALLRLVPVRQARPIGGCTCPLVFDLAVTSGLRCAVAPPPQRTALRLVRTRKRKRSHLDTAALSLQKLSAADGEAVNLLTVRTGDSAAFGAPGFRGWGTCLRCPSPLPYHAVPACGKILP